MGTLLFGLLVLLAGLMLVWGSRRLRDARASAATREVATLAALRAGKDKAAADEAQAQIDHELPMQLSGSRGLEVAHIDIESFLSSVPPGSMARARAQLDEPTSIEVAFTSSGWPSTGNHTGAPITATQSPVTASPTTAAPPPKPPSGLDLDVPLRNLVLAWYEARGYRPAPASSSLRPIEVVLRHRDDPARMYAFVFDPGRATAPRASALLDRARSAGLSKLLIAAEHGGDSALRGNRVRGVRMIDWLMIEADLKKLDRAVADRIIGIARERSAPAERLTAPTR